MLLPINGVFAESSFFPKEKEVSAGLVLESSFFAKLNVDAGAAAVGSAGLLAAASSSAPP